MKNGKQKNAIVIEQIELRLHEHEQLLNDFDITIPVASDKVTEALHHYHRMRETFLLLDSSPVKDMTRVDQARTDLRQARLELQYSIKDLVVRLDSKF